MTMLPHKTHPARDPGFLSRLHDGDLTASERAHFETHRAHCNECRRLASEYEHALSLFRSARSAPAPADMANRVLRKVQSVGRQRRPAPAVFFSVDWRWASAFAAALLVLLVAAPALLRQQSARREAEAPISVALGERVPRSEAAPAPAAPPSAPPAAAAPKEENARKLQADIKQAAPAPSSRSNEVPHVLAPSQQSGGAAPKDAAAYAEAERQRSAFADQLGTAGEKPSNKVAAAQAQVAPPQAAEKLRDEDAARADGGALNRAARVVVQEADGLGSPPQLVAGGSQPALVDLRGRSFLVVVDSSGSVTEVREAAKQEVAQEPKRRQAALGKDKESGSAEPVKRLVFASSDRSRRVLVRVE